MEDNDKYGRKILQLFGSALLFHIMQMAHTGGLCNVGNARARRFNLVDHNMAV